MNRLSSLCFLVIVFLLSVSVAVGIYCGADAKLEPIGWHQSVNSDLEPAKAEKSAHAASSSYPTLDDDDVQSLPVRVEIAGEHGKVISVAYTAFETDDEIPKEKRKIENYQIELRQSKTTYFVLFQPGLPLGERPSLGAGTSLGKDVMYFIKRSDFSLIGRTSFK